MRLQVLQLEAQFIHNLFVVSVRLGTDAKLLAGDRQYGAIAAGKNVLQIVILKCLLLLNVS